MKCKVVWFMCQSTLEPSVLNGEDTTAFHKHVEQEFEAHFCFGALENLRTFS